MWIFFSLRLLSGRHTLICHRTLKQILKFKKPRVNSWPPWCCLKTGDEKRQKGHTNTHTHTLTQTHTHTHKLLVAYPKQAVVTLILWQNRTKLWDAWGGIGQWDFIFTLLQYLFPLSLSICLFHMRLYLPFLSASAPHHAKSRTRVLPRLLCLVAALSQKVPPLIHHQPYSFTNGGPGFKREQRQHFPNQHSRSMKHDFQVHHQSSMLHQCR